MNQRERVLITGAAGRIGAMVREALASDYDLVGIDMRAGEGVDLVADRTDYDAIRPAFAGVDVVIDLANNPSGNLSWEDAYANNIPSSYNCLRAAREAGVKRYVVTSSNRAPPRPTRWTSPTPRSAAALTKASLPAPSS